VRELAPAERDRLLKTQKTGRLGVYDASRERVYVVPVSFVYRDGSIYLHSAPGLKLELLHEHSQHVCFEVDSIADEAEWQSFIGWGRFEEIADARERQTVLRSFGSRLLRGPLRDRQNVGRGGTLGAGETVYRIVLEEVSTRADSQGWLARDSD
jgi:nitroimidazol reductase NimA-like FMN-containing flavoprotein (pyridoxamine 5'-phosphate oxidase superfamily)